MSTSNRGTIRACSPRDRAHADDPAQDQLVPVVQRLSLKCFSGDQWRGDRHGDCSVHGILPSSVATVVPRNPRVNPARTGIARRNCDRRLRRCVQFSNWSGRVLAGASGGAPPIAGAPAIVRFGATDTTAHPRWLAIRRGPDERRALPRAGAKRLGRQRHEDRARCGARRRRTRRRDARSPWPARRSRCAVNRATPHSLASKFSPLKPANVVETGPGSGGIRCRNCASASANPSPFAGAVPYRWPGSIADAAPCTTTLCAIGLPIVG